MWSRTSRREPDPRGDIDFRRGVELEQRGDLVGAMAAYGSAEKRGHVEASSNLGVLHYERGDVARSEECLRRADSGGSASGAFRLGVLLYDRRDLTGAEAAYRRGAERGNRDAAYNLGLLLVRRDPDAAAAAFHQAIRHADSPAAERGPRTELAKLNQRALAEAARQRGATVVSSSDGYATAMAITLQGWESGTVSRELAETTLREVAAQAPPDTATFAWFNLGLLLQRCGATGEARAAYEQATRGVGQAALMAALNLGEMLERTDAPAAGPLFVTAMTADAPDVVARAAVSLGLLRYREGDRAGAMAPTRRAIDAGTGLPSIQGTLLMGVLLHELGDEAGARWRLEQVVEKGGPPPVIAEAAAVLRDVPPVPDGPTDDPEDDVLLGLQREREGDIEGAAAAYTRADARGSGDGASNIGFFRLGWNEPHLAEECYRRADERGSRNGSFRLGLMLHQRGELAAAEQAYVRGAERGSWRAALNLGSLRMNRGDLAGAVGPLDAALRDCDDPSAVDQLHSWLARCRGA